LDLSSEDKTSSSAFSNLVHDLILPVPTGRTFVAPLVDEMLQRISAEVARYERVINYWPMFGPTLEGAVCAALRETTASVTRQCGLAQVSLHIYFSAK